MGTREARCLFWIDACTPATIPMERLAAYVKAGGKSGGKYGGRGIGGDIDCSVRQQLTDSYSHLPKFESLSL